MKKIIFLLSVIAGINASAQITLSHNNLTSWDIWLDKFHLSGYKYVEWTGFPHKINVYNLNNTLFKSMTIPISPPYYLQEVAYVSENLFDLDGGMEYIVQMEDSSKFNVQAVFVIDESGTQLFYRDSAEFAPLSLTSGGYSPNNIFQNREMIFFDGISTKMRLRIHSAGEYETYNLPGTIPCAGCTSGIVSGLISNEENGGNNDSEAKFFPNPAFDQLKLKYKLPEGSHLAEMKIYDMQGKLVEEFKITDTFDFIYLPTNYNNGLYLYSLIVDGKVVKTEKIVLNK
jgi:hypothetical protein